MTFFVAQEPFSDLTTQRLGADTTVENQLKRVDSRSLVSCRRCNDAKTKASNSKQTNAPIHTTLAPVHEPKFISKISHGSTYVPFAKSPVR